MIRRLGLALLFLCIAPATILANGKAQGWCENGNVSVVMQGSGQTSGPQKFQQSYPSCTVTVYLAGTTTKATIFSDNSGTSKGNPFTASTTGQWFFYAVNGAYDVLLSGGGIPAPFTLGAVTVVDPNQASPAFPVANGFICTFLSGASTPSPAYSNASLTTPLPNPIPLNSTGQPTNGTSIVTLYIAALAYKAELHSAGSSSSCNGHPVGALIETADPVYDFGELNAGFWTFGTVLHPVSTTSNVVIGASTEPSAIPAGIGNLSVVGTGGFDVITGSSSSENDVNLRATNAGILFSEVALGSAAHVPIIISQNGAEALRISPSLKITSLPTITNNAMLFSNSSKVVSTDEGYLNWDSTKKLLYVGFGPITDGTFTASGGFVATGAGGVTVATANTNASTGNFNVVTGQYVSINAGRSSPSGTRLPFVIFTGGAEAFRLNTSQQLSLAGLPTITHNAIPFFNSAKTLVTDEGYLNWDSTNKNLYVGFGPMTDYSFGLAGGVFTTGDGGLVVSTANSNAQTLELHVVSGTAASIRAEKTGSGTYQNFWLLAGGHRTLTLDTTGAIFAYPHTGYGNFSTSTTGGAIFGRYGVYSASDTTNGSFMGINTDGSTVADLRSGAVGSGTVLPMGLVVGSTPEAKFETSGTDRTCVYIGGSLQLLTITAGNVTVTTCP